MNVIYLFLFFLDMKLVQSNERFNELAITFQLITLFMISLPFFRTIKLIKDANEYL